ncbi:PREDICTED: nuclear protein 1 isoform X2 [Colobus angolensis palliatus]|uniref:nuclear protein 1 isoform X2 n=1 Tax=Colobus angolensis palliatus TaxID=336983 RepID=UPI0005F504C7|nr:PREDICTED: nuclear protein 1 isoform X2 [Colobus angolensis palliatus]
MATFPPATSAPQQPPGPEDEDPSLDESDLYSLAHSYLVVRPERSHQERSCCQHQPPQPWRAREETGDQAAEFREEEARGTTLRQSWR